MCFKSQSARGTISKQPSTLIPSRGSGSGNSTHASSLTGLWYLSILCFITSTHTHLWSLPAVRHILMALLWPEHAWSGPGCGGDPGLTATHQSYSVWERAKESCTHERKKEKKIPKRTNTLTGKIATDGWLLGHRCEDLERKWESFHHFFSPNPSFTFKEVQLPPTHIFENIPFPSTFPLTNLKKLAVDFAPFSIPTLLLLHLLLSIRPCLESQALSARAIYMTWLQNAFAQFSNYSIMPWSSGSHCLSHFLPFTQTTLDV